MELDGKHTKVFDTLDQNVTDIPCPADTNSNKPNKIITDTSTEDLGATSWQEQPDGKMKPIRYSSRFLSDLEKNMQWKNWNYKPWYGLERFRLYIYGKPIQVLTDQYALEPQIKSNWSNKSYSAQLIELLDQLLNFSINVSHSACRLLAQTNYLSRNASSPLKADDAYEQYVINSIIPHYEFVSKAGCLDNNCDESQLDKMNAQTPYKTNNEQNKS